MNNIKNRYTQFKRVKQAQTMYDLGSIAHDIFLNSQPQSDLQNQIAMYCKVWEAFHDREDMFRYFRDGLLKILIGEQELKKWLAGLLLIIMMIMGTFLLVKNGFL